MIVIGNGLNIEKFEIESSNQADPLELEGLGHNHILLFGDNMD